MKAVVDTNVVVSGLLWPGPSALVLDAAERRKFHFLTSDDLLAELQEVLCRSHLRPRLQSRGRTVQEVMAGLRVLAALVTSAELVLPPNLRDRKDLPVLRCAVGGAAQAIVTGDKDLLTIKEFQGIIIVTPREFVTTLGL